MRSAVVLILAASIAMSCIGCSDDEQVNKVAAAMTGGDPNKGKSELYVYGCTSCHTIPGVHGANALVGPPLTQMASRSYIGGVMKNTPENMIQWLKNPPGIDEKTAMPNLHLTDSDARDIAGFLYTLR